MECKSEKIEKNRNKIRKNMDNDEDDIYNDLPEETTSDYIAKIENKLESVQKQYDESQTLIKELTIEKHNHQNRIKELEKTIEDLGRNMSSLYKTAVVEIKRKDNMLNELRAENDDLAFRRQKNNHNKPTNCNQGRIRDHKRDREKHRKDGSPVEEKNKHSARHSEEVIRCKRLGGSPAKEKYKYWSRNNADTVRCRRSDDSRSRCDERQRLEVKHEKHSSCDRNDYRHVEFHSQERHRKTKMMDIKERHSTSPRNRIRTSCDIKNRPEVQESFPLAKRERRSIPEKYPKLYPFSSYVKNEPEVQNSVHCDKDEYRNSKENHPKSEIISSYAKNASESQNSLHDRNEYRNSQEIYVKCYSVSASGMKSAEAQNSLQHDENKYQNSQEKNIKSHIVSSSVKNCAEVQNSLQYDEYKQRNKQEKCLKSQTISSSVKTSAEVQNSLHRDENKRQNDLEKPTKSPIVYSSAKNSVAVQNSLKHDENKHRNGLEKHPKFQIVSSSVKNSTEVQSSLRYDKNELRKGQETHPKSQTISSCPKNGPQAQNNFQCNNNEHQKDQEKHPKSQIISARIKNDPIVKKDLQCDKTDHRKNKEKHLKSQTTSSGPKNVPEPKIVPVSYRTKHLCDRNFVNHSTIGGNSSTGTNSQTENYCSIKNNLETPSTVVPDLTKKSSNRVADRLEALFDSNDDHTSRDVPVSQNENHTTKENEKTETTEDILDQMSNFMRCEAALRSMKKRPQKLLTPMKPTPDLLKEKYSQIEQAENSKKNPVVPMINEKRMLSPYKNVGVVEIICQSADDVEPSKSTESEPVAACSVTVTEDIEHGVFSRKSRKRPRIQKMITGVKKVHTS